MSNLIKRIKDWRSRRPSHIEMWEQQRARGVVAYITRTAVMYSTAVVILIAAFDLISDGVIDTAEIEFRLISGTITGLFIGWFGWSQNENDYEKALREARARAGITTPIDPQLSIISPVDSQLEDPTHKPRN